MLTKMVGLLTQIVTNLIEINTKLTVIIDLLKTPNHNDTALVSKIKQWLATAPEK